MAAKSTKKAPRRAVAEETRKRLLAAGRRAFAAKGLGGANLRDDILKPAKTSAGSFYHQFDDKTGLLLEILETDGARVREQIQNPPRNADRGDLARAAFSVYFDMADANPEFVKIYVREYYSDDRRVRRKIREYNASTIKNVSASLDLLNAARGLSIDTELGGLLMSNLAIAVVNHYLGLSAAERRRMREPLLTGLAQLLTGGISAVVGVDR
jgi:AcrR family transcriptional regulator